MCGCSFCFASLRGGASRHARQVRRVRDAPSPVRMRLASKRWPVTPAGAMDEVRNVTVAVPSPACLSPRPPPEEEEEEEEEEEQEMQ